MDSYSNSHPAWAEYAGGRQLHGLLKRCQHLLSPTGQTLAVVAAFGEENKYHE